jgi:hypothetical protein
VRAQLARGDLRGAKIGGQWRVERRHLPLTEAQREALQRKADGVRAVVEDALPSRRARRGGERTRSVSDLDAFRVGAEVLGELRRETAELDQDTRQRAQAALEGALVALTESALHFDPPAKKRALERCRAELACVVTLLLLAGDGEPAAWAHQLEQDMAPAVAGLARWIDRLREKRK